METKYLSSDVTQSVILTVSHDAGEKANARYTSGYAALRLTGPLSRGDFYIAESAITENRAQLPNGRAS